MDRSEWRQVGYGFVVGHRFLTWRRGYRKPKAGSPWSSIASIAWDRRSQ